MEIFGIHNQLTSACCSPPVPDAEHSCPVWHGMLREVSPPQGNYLDAFHPRKSSLLIPGGQLTLSPRSTELTSQWHVCCDQRQTHFRWILRRVVSSWHCTGRYFCDSQHLWWLGQVPVGLCNGGGLWTTRVPCHSEPALTQREGSRESCMAGVFITNNALHITSCLCGRSGHEFAHAQEGIQVILTTPVDSQNHSDIRN